MFVQYFRLKKFIEKLFATHGLFDTRYQTFDKNWRKGQNSGQKSLQVLSLLLFERLKALNTKMRFLWL